ncbi:MAG: hypothetical protein KF716_15035 [Anaerolineae bacterium]|nr:hypothetical protein [Anaerolineae bacterium]
MSFDLNAMLTTATDIMNGISPILFAALALLIVAGLFNFITQFVEEYHALQNGRLNPPEKVKNTPPPDDDPPPLRSEKHKRKNDEILGIGDDGELIYADESEEPLYMRKFR